MNTLHLTNHIKSELGNIIDNAISNKMLNKEKLRMIILMPNATFDALLIHYNNEWEDYYDHYSNEDKAPIGTIDISEWLDIADRAFEKRDKIDGKYIEAAKTHNKKYNNLPPVLQFDHITEEPYKSYLISLRETLIDQIKEAVNDLATSKYANTFNHLVGFVLYKLVYDHGHQANLVAFSHKDGAGPFYNVNLTLPNIKLTYPHLKFYDSGFTLFYPIGNKIDDDIKEESNVYTFDVNDIHYAQYKSGRRQEVTFRLKGEFEDWKLSGGHIHEEFGDLSEDAFFDAFNELLRKYPDIVLDTENVPHPLNEESAFKKWLSNFTENNLPLSYSNKKQIIEWGEEAITKTLELLPNTHPDHQSIKRMWAGEHFNRGDYKKAAEILEAIKKLSDHYKFHLLQTYYFLNDKNGFEACYKSIGNKISKKDALLMQWFFDIKVNSSNQKNLAEIEQSIYKFLEENKGYTSENNSWLALTKLYIHQNDETKANDAFREVDLSYLNLYTLAKKEFESIPYIKDKIVKYDKKKAQKNEIDQWIKEKALKLPEEDPVKFEKAKYDDCYVIEKVIEDVDLKWARPISGKAFIGYTEEEIFIAELSPEFTIDKRSAIALDKKKSYAPTYHNGILFLVIEDEGIVRYTTDNNKLELAGIIKNENAKPKYRRIAVNNQLLYACNDEFLEIFNLTKSYTNPVLEDFYIDRAFWLHVTNNTLIVNCGSHILLIDITDPTKPEYLSAIDGIVSRNNGYIKVVKDHLICSHIINIKDPEQPKYVCTTEDEVAPVYSFSTNLPDSVYATGGDYLLKQFKNDDEQCSSVNWKECLNQSKNGEQRIVYNHGVVYSDDKLITFSEYNISLFKKEVHPSTYLNFDVHTPVKNMVLHTFNELVDNHPNFLIGKIILKSVPYSVDLKFHYCPSVPIVEDYFNKDRKQQIFVTNLDLRSYLENETGKAYNPEFTNVHYDADEIIQEITNDPEFKKRAAKHVAVITNDRVRWLHFPDNKWVPYRSNEIVKDDESVLSILLSGHKNLIDKLKEHVSKEVNIVHELLDIINYQPKDTPAPKGTPNSKNGNLKLNRLSVPYVRPPEMTPPSENNKDVITENIKKLATKIFCYHNDRNLVKNVLLNGAKYGIARPVVPNPIPEKSVDTRYLKQFANNYWNILKEFGDYPEVKSFLISTLEKDIDPEIAAKLAVHYKIWKHPSIRTYMEVKLSYNGFPFFEYIGGPRRRGINFSALPAEVFLPIKDKLLGIYNQYIKTDDKQLDRKVKNGIVTVYAILNKLGHEEMPDKLAERIENIKKANEKYDDDLFDDPDFQDDEEQFLLRMHREKTAKKIISSLQNNEDGPIWEPQWKPEPYKKSWYNMFDILLTLGSVETGERFNDQFIKTLCANIEKDEAYENDRIMAINFVHYSFKRIFSQPQLASLAASLVKAINANKQLFGEDIDPNAIKEKSKYALLQDAWNNLKDGEYDVAEKKCDAILTLDPEFGQAYFLQARLIWLKDGLATYLEQRDVFIEKAAHDQAAVGRLYNLSGCALDVEQRYEEALSYFKKAALTSPTEALYFANIAEMYYKMKQPDDAIYYAEKTKEKGGVSDIVEEILKNNGVIDASEK